MKSLLHTNEQHRFWIGSNYVILWATLDNLTQHQNISKLLRTYLEKPTSQENRHAQIGIA